jgi:hypothetical protein
MDRKTLALAAAAFLLCSALYAAWLWQPERQVRLHHAHFLGAVERRKWDKVQGFVADNYSDRWGHDKEFVLREAREVFRQFLFLTIQGEPQSCSITGREAEIRAPIRLAGDGSPIAHLVVERVNALREPFAFAWARQSWRPWDWQLTRLDHPALDLDRERAF